MINPYKLANELNEKEWLWKTAKWEMIIVAIIALIMVTGIIISQEVHFSWSLLAIVWYGIYLRGKQKLYIKNLMLFENWEALYGPTVKKKEEKL